MQYVVIALWMLCCPVGYMERAALPPMTGLTDQIIISGMLSIDQSSKYVLQLVSHSVIQDICSISVVCPRSSNVKQKKILVALGTRITLFKLIN